MTLARSQSLILGLLLFAGLHGTITAAAECITEPEASKPTPAKLGKAIQCLQAEIQRLERELAEKKKSTLTTEAPQRSGSFTYESTLRSLNTVYTAGTDGFVLVYGKCSEAGWAQIELYVGNESEPKDLVAGEMLGGTHWRDNGSFSVPIRAGMRWKVKLNTDPSGSVACNGTAIRWVDVK